jgi:hypothetical protein
MSIVWMAARKDPDMSTVTDVELEAKVAEQMHQLEAQRDDPAFQLELIHDLFRRVHVGEVEYGVPWYEAHAAVRSGKIYETFEVCVWLFDINSLNDLISGS